MVVKATHNGNRIFYTNNATSTAVKLRSTLSLDTNITTMAIAGFKDEYQKSNTGCLARIAPMVNMYETNEVKNKRLLNIVLYVHCFEIRRL